MVGRGMPQEQFCKTVNCHQNIHGNTEINADCCFCHYKSTRNFILLQEASTYATTIRNIIYVFYIYAKTQPNPPYGFREDFLFIYFSSYLDFLLVTIKNSHFDKNHNGQ